MTLNTYLYFDGNCAAAFDFYKSVFGGEYEACMKFSDGPPDFDHDPSDKDLIMHVSLPVGSSVLMGSDVGKGNSERPVPSNSFSISYSASTKEETDRIFASLMAGGAETMPLQDTFWGSYFGMCKDQFGIHWMVSVDQNSAA